MQVMKITHLNGQEFLIPAPSQWDITLAAVSAATTQRGQDSGELMIDRVAVKTKHECTWTGISWSQLDLIARAIKVDITAGAVGAVTFNLHTPSVFLASPSAHTLTPKKVYAGDLNITPIMFNELPSKTVVTVKCNFIEV